MRAFKIGLILAAILTTASAAYIALAVLASARQDGGAWLKSLLDSQVQARTLATEKQRAETARTLAAIEQEKAADARRAQIKSKTIVTTAETLSASAVALLPASTIALCGAAAVVGLRRLSFARLETPRMTVCAPVRAVYALAEKHIEVDRAEAAGRVAVHSDALVNARISGIASLFGRMRGLFAGPTMNQPALASAEPTTTQAVELPTFSEIFESREVGGEMVLGYDDAAEPRLGRYEAVHSCLVYGTAGSGKTSWLRGLTGQTVLTAPDSRVFVIDPHAAREDSLFKSLPKTSHFQAIDADHPEPFLQGFRDELRRRLLSDEQEFAPRVLLIDELNEVARKDYKPLLVKTCEEVAQQGRKVNVFLIASAQDLREKKIGDFRASLSSAYFFKGKSSQVKAFLDDNDAAKLYRQNVTRQGVALFSSADDEPRLTVVPECKAADVRRVAELLANDDTTPPKLETFETPAERGETDETAYRSDDDFRAVFMKRMEETGETLSGLAARIGVNKGGFYRFLKDGAASSDAMRSRFASFLGRCEVVS